MKNQRQYVNANMPTDHQKRTVNRKGLGLLAKNFLNRWMSWGALQHKKCCSTVTPLWEFEKTFARLQVARQRG